MGIGSEYEELNRTFSQLNQLNQGYALAILRSLNFAQESILANENDNQNTNSV